jgi:hypothetical protein
MAADQQNKLAIRRPVGNNVVSVDYQGLNTTVARSISTTTLNWMHITMVYKLDSFGHRAYLDAAQVGADQAIANAMTGNLSNIRCCIGNYATQIVAGAKGYASYVYLLNRAATVAELITANTILSGGVIAPNP